MTGFRLFLAVVQIVLRRLGAAIRLSVVPVALFLAVAALAVYLANLADRDGPAQAAIVVIWGYGMFTAIWVAVNWHRLILTDQRARWLPPVPLRDMGAYLVQLIPILILALLFMMALIWWVWPTVMPAIFQYLYAQAPYLGMTAFKWLFFLINFFLSAIAGAIFLRLGAMLAATAIGATIGGVWSATRGAWGSLLIMSSLIMITQLAIGWLADEAMQSLIASAYAAQSSAMLMVALSAGVVMIGSFLAFMLQLTALSMVYARYVQGRELR